MDARKKAREHYYNTFGNSDYGGRVAPCQGCGEPMAEDDHRTLWIPTAAHKTGRGVGGSDEFSNFVIMHWGCHDGFDNHSQARKEVLKNSYANIENGQMVEMPEIMRENIKQFKYTGHRSHDEI